MTSYTIKKSNSNILVELAEGQTDNVSSSLTLVGKNVYNFGQSQNTNLVHLLENFAFTQSPVSPTTGQLWFNTTNKSLNVFKGSEWSFIPDMAIIPAPISTDTTGTGSLMFNSTTGQLFVKNGASYTLIGPTATPGYGKTQIVSNLIYGTEVPTSLPHAVLECIVGDQVIAIISSSNFNINSTNPVPNFTSVYTGITMNSMFNTIFGTATKSNQLLNDAGNMYLSASTASNVNSIMQRDVLGNTAVNNLSVANIVASNSIIAATGQISAASISTSAIYGDGVLFGNWLSHGSVSPAVNFGSDLGSTAIRWGAIHGQSITTDRVNFSALVDNADNAVTGFDTDITMSADSDNVIGTQKAVKTYVDSSSESLQQQIATLRTQVNNIPLFPAGTVLFTAGSTAPAGFLAATGQSLSKTIYAALYAVIGGTYGQASATFNLPDLRGQFIRGVDAGANIDPGRILGSTQSDDFKSHRHNSDGNSYVTWPQFGNSYGRVEQNQEGGPQDYSSLIPHTAYEGGSETRPKNIAMLGIIKY